MKTLDYLKRITLTAVVVLSLGLAIAPRAEASAQLSTSSHTITDPTFGGGGKDGNESHG